MDALGFSPKAGSDEYVNAITVPWTTDVEHASSVCFLTFTQFDIAEFGFRFASLNFGFPDWDVDGAKEVLNTNNFSRDRHCLLYTSDAADE